MNGTNLEELRLEIASFADKTCSTCFFKESSMSMVDPCFTCSMWDCEPLFPGWTPDSWSEDKVLLFEELTEKEVSDILNSDPEYKKLIKAIAKGYFNKN